MFSIMSLVFVLGIAAIALEDKIKVDKAASALLTALVLWLLYLVNAPQILAGGNSPAFLTFLAENPDAAALPSHEQYLRFIVDNQITDHLGDVSSTLFFVMGAMTIIALIDAHAGFQLVADRIHTVNKRRMLWIVGGIAFVISALLDNLATAIVMVAMLRKLIPSGRERWIYAGAVLIAANAGGAWSPVGDVTTILLWNHGNLTPAHQVSRLILPSLTCLGVSLWIVSRFFGKHDRWDADFVARRTARNRVALPPVALRSRVVMLAAGILSLAIVPLVNVWTGLPPFMSVLFGMAVLWIYTDWMYAFTPGADPEHNSFSGIFARIDMSTVFYFLGILMAVAALESVGQLMLVSDFLDRSIHDPLLIAFFIGLMSAVLDNVALVAGTIAMYPLPDADAAGHLAYFAANGEFWTFLAYCAVTGGSILIIGSATGVTVMGMEKIPFAYYTKRFTWIALTGYVCGAGVYLLLTLL